MLAALRIGTYALSSVIQWSVLRLGPELITVGQRLSRVGFFGLGRSSNGVVPR